ncbi:MAG: glycosyltransferase family 2 protein [Methanolinea sp.]|jgi:glycosyltransferase involved in cell wall biosynthesis|nr:glycosyltransferase family 2 protein [Methanolinea sp.]
MMHPDERPDTTAGDPEIRIGENAISSLLAHYFQFEETLGMNTAKGAVPSLPRSSRSSPHPLLSRVIPGMSYAEDTGTEDLSSPEELPKRIIAVIPAYNEELTIGTVVLATRQYVDHVIVVDDGSTDRTARIATLAGAEVLENSINLGKAQALMKGFARARHYGPLAVVMLDADGQHNPAEIPELAKPVLSGKADMVVGSRFLNGTNRIPKYRVLGQKTLDLATKVGSGIPCTDSQSGFRVLGRRALANLDFYSEGYNIESDMLAHFAGRGLTVAEVPIGITYDVTNGHKKHALAHGLDVLGHIIGIIGYRRPLITFGIPGAVMTFLGAGMSVYTVTELYTGGTFHSIMFVGGITLLILGLLLVTTSLILNSLVQVVKMGKA